MRLIAVPLASPVHGREYYESLLSQIKPQLVKAGFKVTDIVDSVDKACRVSDAHTRDILLLVFLTGGTSKLAREILLRNNYRYTLALCHGKHNSLPSALSARARLAIARVRLVPYFYESLEECGDVLNRASRVARAFKALKTSRVGVISDGIVTEIEAFSMTFGSEVVSIKYKEFEEYVSRAPRSYVEEAKERLSGLGLEGVDSSSLEKALEIYGGLRLLVEDKKLNALAMDCFPYIVKRGVTPCLALALLNSEGIVAACEADLTALTLMIMSKELTGKTGWIANPSTYRGNEMVLAHCTISLNMTSRGRVVPHFETGKPYSLAAELGEKVYTMATISYDFEILVATKVEVLKSGMLSEERCRTQAVLKLGFPAERVLRTAPANHHVLIPGDVKKELRDICELLGIWYLTYNSL